MPQQRDGAPTAERSTEEVVTSTEQLSPELVLVLPPELAERARAALPDRPWERFAAASGDALPTAPTAELRLRPPAVTVPAAPALRPTRAAPTVVRPERHRAVQRVPAQQMPVRRAGFSRLLAPVATIAFALAAVTWASEQTPPLTPVADPVPPTAAPAPRATVPTPPAVVGRPTSSPKQRVRVTPGPSAASRVEPVPRGGYVFARGRLVVAATGRAFERVELANLCSRAITISRLPIAARGTFAYSGPALRGRFRVELSGRFVDRRHVRLGVVVRGPGCLARRITAVGTLS